MPALNPFLSDLGQRLLTRNKRQEKRDLLQWLGTLRLPPGTRVLDFGCGTGLFATTLQALGFAYTGFDPDAAAIEYARSRYAGPTFVSALADAAPLAPFDLVVANCCFHHIGDDALRHTTLPAIAGLMRPGATLLVLDVLPLGPDASLARRLYNLFEEGAHKRDAAHHERLLAERFTVCARATRRSFALSAAHPANPLYNDVIQLEARRR